VSQQRQRILTDLGDGGMLRRLWGRSLLRGSELACGESDLKLP
jgi:hypothetical protein